MPGGRAILRALDLQPKVRVILTTIDGRIIVRPPAPNKITLCDRDGTSVVAAWLSDEGKAAWDRGEDIDFNEGHIMAMGDLRGLIRAEF